MPNYIILSDSGTDFSKAKAKEVDVEIIDLYVTVEGEQPVPDSEVDTPALYAQLRAKKSVSTAAINLDDFSTKMRKYLEAGNDVLYLGFSSGLSSTYGAGRFAAEELASEFPERKIYTVDTLCASLGQGLLVYLAAKKRLEGASIEEVRDFVEATKLNLCHWFTVDDLFFLKRGGRVSAATAVVGTVLGIKPIMHVDNEGKLIKVGVARGRKASIDELFNNLKASMIAIGNEDETEGVKIVKSLDKEKREAVFISHGDCIDDAVYLANRITNELGIEDVYIDYVGSVIGSHSGPGTLALFYLGTQR